jgi:hypothetical protein
MSYFTAEFSTDISELKEKMRVWKKKIGHENGKKEGYMKFA